MAQVRPRSLLLLCPLLRLLLLLLPLLPLLGPPLLLQDSRLLLLLL